MPNLFNRLELVREYDIIISMTETEFEKLYISDLNSQQKAAVRETDGPVLLLAVPGSGKTTVLIRRLGYMIYVSGIAPENILTMTYTVAATREMRARFSEFFGSEYADRLEFRTINSLAQSIIDYYGRTCSRRRPFDIESDDGELSGIVRKIYMEVNQEYPDDSTVKEVRTAITYLKNMMFSAENIEGYETELRNLPELFRRYNQELKSRCLMDYDDQLSYALAVLKTKPQVLEYFQNRFFYINVDEVQDTSKIQHAIIRKLAGRYRNIFMVGDEDQSIYGFRAAYPEALMNFREDYPEAKIRFLEQNYRSTPEIVNAANGFIVRNRSRYAKAASAARASGPRPDKLTFSGRPAQYRFVCDIAERCQRETAFLYRNNDSAVPLIDLFEKRGIRYNCRAFDDTFFTNRIVSDITDIAEFARNPADADVFMRIYYKLGCGINKTAASEVSETARRTGAPILNLLGGSRSLKQFSKDSVAALSMHFRMLLNDTAETALTRIRTAMGYGEYVRKMKLDENKYDILCVLAKDERNIYALLDKLNRLRRIISEHQNSPDNRVILSTVHSSKGLEYDRVFLLDVFNGILPSVASEDLESADEMKNYEEDRRIFYVAMTRAKNELHVLDVGKKSDFLSEVFPEEQRTYGDVVKHGLNTQKRVDEDNAYVKNGIIYPRKRKRKSCDE